jgi:hypothetical protein
MPDELKHCGVDGHAEGLPPELSAESKIGLGLVLDVYIETVGIPRRPEAGTAEPRPYTLQFNARHQEFVPDMDCGVLGLVCVRPDDLHCSLANKKTAPSEASE